MNYIKSPLNYTGGKYKLLSQIIPLFPNKINTFVDLFGGGFNVGININANNIIYNEKDFHIVELLKYFKNNDIDSLLEEADNIIGKFKLSKENQDGYNNLRDYYNNQNSNPMVFYILLCYAFNNQIRFNQEGKYNMPFGKNRSSFNPMLRKRFILFVEALQRLECDFTNLDFRYFPFQILTDGDFVYCDPPYEGTTKYKDDFDHKAYWNWVREMSKNNIVLCSEYNAPDDFECIWTKQLTTTLDNASRIKATEKLFKYKGGVWYERHRIMGRKFIGIELEPKYFAIAQKRIQDIAV